MTAPKFHAETDIAALPIWEGRPDFVPLDGGLSNLSFLATDRAGKYVVRLTRDFPFHQVFRDREVAVARAAHTAGFAPEVVHAAPGLMISRFVEAKPLTASAVRNDIARIAELLARFHREMGKHAPRVAFSFDVFAVNRDYVRQLAAHSPVADLAEWAGLNERLEAMQSALPPVFGHHDLLPGNWLDDGTRLWLIDFEYAGRGAPIFDLANLTSNSGFTPAQSDTLLRAYFGHAPDTAMLRSHRAMEAASLLREALWSLVSAVHIRERDVDYAGYATVNFARLREALRAL